MYLKAFLGKHRISCWILRSGCLSLNSADIILNQSLDDVRRSHINRGYCDTIAIRIFLAAAPSHCAQLKQNAVLILACQFKYLTAYRYICYNITLQSGSHLYRTVKAGRQATWRRTCAVNQFKLRLWSFRANPTFVWFEKHQCEGLLILWKVILISHHGFMGDLECGQRCDGDHKGWFGLQFSPETNYGNFMFLLAYSALIYGNVFLALSYYPLLLFNSRRKRAIIKGHNYTNKYY